MILAVLPSVDDITWLLCNVTVTTWCYLVTKWRHFLTKLRALWIFGNVILVWNGVTRSSSDVIWRCRDVTQSSRRFGKVGLYYEYFVWPKFSLVAGNYRIAEEAKDRLVELRINWNVFVEKMLEGLFEYQIVFPCPWISNKTVTSSIFFNALSCVRRTWWTECRTAFNNQFFNPCHF